MVVERRAAAAASAVIVLAFSHRLHVSPRKYVGEACKETETGLKSRLVTAMPVKGIKTVTAARVSNLSSLVQKGTKGRRDQEPNGRPPQNGVGAFILQCKRLDFHYCNYGGSSRGML